MRGACFVRLNRIRQGQDRSGVFGDPTLRRAFRAFIVQPPSETIEASSPGLLIVALNRVCGALATDGEVMPPEVSDSLGLEAGASYRQSAAAAKAQWSRVSRAIDHDPTSASSNRQPA